MTKTVIISISIASLIVAGLVAGLGLVVWAIAEGEQQRHEWRHDVLSAWEESTTRDDVRARLGEATFATRITSAGRSRSCDVYNAYDSIVQAWVQFPFCYAESGLRVPSPDPLEPNDDVSYLKAYKILPLMRPGKPSARIRARLDYWPEGDETANMFDAEDVYRAWVPRGRALRIRLVPDADVALAVWDSKTSSVGLEGAAQKRHLIAVSDESGSHSEEVTVSRPRRPGAFVYLDVYLLDRGPNHAEYDLTVTPTAQR